MRNRPEGPKKLVTQAEFARIRGVSRQSVNKAVKAGRIVATRTGLIDSVEAARAWAANSSPIAGGDRQAGVLGRTEPRARRRDGVTDRETSRAVTPSQRAAPRAKKRQPDTFVAVRIERERLAIDSAKREERVRLGELLERDHVRKAIRETVVSVRDRLLAIPTQASPLLAPAMEPAKAHSILTRLIQDALEGLSKLDGVGAEGRRA